jgi:hypothetical protein
MSFAAFCLFALFIFSQSANIPLLDGTVLIAEEKARIARSASAEDRIKVYESASKRIQDTFQAAIASDDFYRVPEILKRWTDLLSGSLADIEANLKTKKKSKALIRYEIQVRKSIGDCRSYKARAPVDQQDGLDASIAKAEEIRRQFVDIIFKH